MDREDIFNQKKQPLPASMKRRTYLNSSLPPIYLTGNRESSIKPRVKCLSSIDEPWVIWSDEPIPGSSTGPATKNTGRPNSLKKMPSRNPTIPPPRITKIPKRKANDQGMSSPSQPKVEVRGNTNMDETVARVNSGQQVSSAVMDYINSASFKSHLEQNIMAEIRAKIAETVKAVDMHQHAMRLGKADGKVQDISQDQQSSHQSVSQSSVQTEAPAKSRQEECASNFGIITAFLLASALRETRDQMIEQLQSKSPEIPAASNSTPEMVGNVFDSIIASLINSIDSNDSQNPLCESTDPTDATMFVSTTPMEMDEEHISHVPSPPSTKEQDLPGRTTRGKLHPITKPRTLSNRTTLKPPTSSEKSGLGEASVKNGSKKKERPPFFINTALAPPTKLRGRPMRASVRQKEQHTSRGPDDIQKRKPCDFPYHIGIGPLPPEATGDLNYLFRAAPRILPPLRKSPYIGEVGWGIQRGLQLNSRTLLSDHQIKLTGFRLDMEDRILRMPPYLRVSESHSRINTRNSSTWGRISPPTLRGHSTLFRLRTMDHGLGFGGADAHPSRFTLGCEP